MDDWGEEMRKGLLLIDGNKNTMLINPLTDADDIEPCVLDALRGDLRKKVKSHQTQAELIADIKRYLKQEYVEGAES